MSGKRFAGVWLASMVPAVCRGQSMPDPCARIDSAVEWTQCVDLSAVSDGAGTIATVAVMVAIAFAGAHLVKRIIREATRA